MDNITSSIENRDKAENNAEQKDVIGSLENLNPLIRDSVAVNDIGDEDIGGYDGFDYSKDDRETVFLHMASEPHQKFNISMEELIDMYSQLNVPHKEKVVEFLKKLKLEDELGKVKRIIVPAREELWDGVMSIDVIVEHLIATKEHFKNTKEPNNMYFKEKLGNLRTEEGKVHLIPLQTFIQSAQSFDKDPKKWSYQKKDWYSSIWQVPIGIAGLKSILEQSNLRFPTFFNKKHHIKITLRDRATLGHFIVTVGGHITDVHVDPPSLSGYTSLFFGHKLWVWFPPTPKNLKLCAKKLSSMQGEEYDGIFFIDKWDEFEDRSWGTLCAGEHLIVPPTYIHAVISFDNSAIFGEMFTDYDQFQVIKDHLVWFAENEIEHELSNDKVFDDYKNTSELWIECAKSFQRDDFQLATSIINEIKDADAIIYPLTKNEHLLKTRTALLHECLKSKKVKK